MSLGSGGLGRWFGGDQWLSQADRGKPMAPKSFAAKGRPLRPSWLGEEASRESKAPNRARSESGDQRSCGQVWFKGFAGRRAQVNQETNWNQKARPSEWNSLQGRDASRIRNAFVVSMWGPGVQTRHEKTMGGDRATMIYLGSLII